MPLPNFNLHFIISKEPDINECKNINKFLNSKKLPKDALEVKKELDKIYPKDLENIKKHVASVEKEWKSKEPFFIKLITSYFTKKDFPQHIAILAIQQPVLL